MIIILLGNWNDGLREIIRSCYEYSNLDPKTYIAQDPEDQHERLIPP